MVTKTLLSSEFVACRKHPRPEAISRYATPLAPWGASEIFISAMPSACCYCIHVAPWRKGCQTVSPFRQPPERQAADAINPFGWRRAVDMVGIGGVL